MTPKISNVFYAQSKKQTAFAYRQLYKLFVLDATLEEKAWLKNLNLTGPGKTDSSNIKRLQDLSERLENSLFARIRAAESEAGIEKGKEQPKKHPQREWETVQPSKGKRLASSVHNRIKGIKDVELKKKHKLMDE